MSFQNSYAEVLSLSVSILRNVIYRVMIKANEVIRMGPQFNRISVLIRREPKNLFSLFLCLCTKMHVDMVRWYCPYKPQRKSPQKEL